MIPMYLVTTLSNYMSVEPTVTIWSGFTNFFIHILKILSGIFPVKIEDGLDSRIIVLSAVRRQVTAQIPNSGKFYG